MEVLEQAMRVFAVLILILNGCSATQQRSTEKMSILQGHLEAGSYNEVQAGVSESTISELHYSVRANAYLVLGNSFARSDNKPRALQIFQYAVGLYPKDLNLLTALADLLLNVGLPDRAKPYYLRVVKIHPNNAASNLGLARIYRIHGYLAKSEEHYRRTLQEWSDNPMIWRGFANVLADQRQYEEATEAIAKALALKHEAQSLLSLARFERQQKFTKEAYAHLAQALDSAKPEQRRRITQRKALWLLEDEKIDACARTTNELLKESPNDPLGRWIRASLALRRGKQRQAREDLAAAARAIRTHPFIAKTAQAMLKEMIRAQ
jgi:tetratricopeptide (TPR) repeat protein